MMLVKDKYVKFLISKQIVIVLCSCFALFQSVYAADGIRKIVHPDGTIEYTNVVTKKGGSVVRSGAKKPYEAIYKYRKNNGVLTYTDVKPRSGVIYETLKFECFACNPGSTVDWHSTPLNRNSYAKLVNMAATAYGVEESLIRAVMHAESAFKKDAVSSQGAQGLMQLMPATAKELGVKDAMKPADNINGGVKYLSQLLARYDGNTKLATAAYNAGPGAVKKYDGVPPYAETEAYVKRVEILRKRYKGVR